LDWYQNIFLNLYSQKSDPNSKERNGEIVSEERVAVTTQELIEETYKVLKKHYTSKSLLTEFLYPLLNLGYIDSIHSLIDKRAYIYYPVLEVTNEKSINLFLLDKKTNLFRNTQLDNVKSTLNSIKKCIISNISEVQRYYSENKYSVTLRNADEDTTAIAYSIEEKGEENEDKNVEEIIEKYYSKFNAECEDDDQINPTNKDQNVAAPESSSVEEYLQKSKNNNDLQGIQVRDIKNSNNSLKLTNKLFTEEEKNKIIYSCYYCKCETGARVDYEKHVVLKHPKRSAYPNMATIAKEGLKPQQKPWEKEM